MRSPEALAKVAAFLAREWGLEARKPIEGSGYDHEWWTREPEDQMVAFGYTFVVDKHSSYLPKWTVPVRLYNTLLRRSLTAPAVYGMANPVGYVVYRFDDPSLYVLDIKNVDTDPKNLGDIRGVPVYYVGLDRMERMDAPPVPKDTETTEAAS